MGCDKNVARVRFSAVVNDWIRNYLRHPLSARRKETWGIRYKVYSRCNATLPMRARQVSKYDLPFNVWRSACLANVFAAAKRYRWIRDLSFITRIMISRFSLGRETDVLPIKIVAISEKCTDTVILSTDNWYCPLFLWLHLLAVIALNNL